MRNEGSRRSGRSGGSEASTATGHLAREVVVPMPSRDELGDAHTDPPLDRVTLAARQPDPAGTQQVPPGPDGRQRHLSTAWDMVLESRGVQGTFRISFPCPIVVRRGANLIAGQEPVGMFAYRLASGHWRVQTGVSRIGEEGTVTTAGVFGLNVLTGWDQRRPEWADVAWLAMRVHVGRQRKMGVADVIDVEEDEPPTSKRKGRPQGDTEPPPPPKPRVRPPRGSGRCGRSRRSRWRGGGRGGWYGEVGGRGRPGDEGGVEGAGGGPCRDRLGGSAKRAWAASPSHNPTLPTASFPTHNTWSTLGNSQLDKSPATSRASLGGVASKCVVLAWWCFCRGSGVQKLKRAPCSPSLESGRAGNPWWRLVATISSMSPRCSSTVSQCASPASPKAVPACTATW